MCEETQFCGCVDSRVNFRRGREQRAVSTWPTINTSGCCVIAACAAPWPRCLYDDGMRLFESPGTLKGLRRTAWEFQRTFQTPLQDLARFVDVIMSALPAVDGARAVFEQVVFEPGCVLVPLYTKYSLPQTWYGDDLTIEAEGAAEARELLHAVLSEWIDFFFVPTPRRFVIYADHDEYITFLAHRKGQLSDVVEALNGAKFRAVEFVRYL
jgi:hypothetical protein